MRVFLVGFMGSGKTTVGRYLAARLGVAFVDLDQEVESKAGMSVAEIFRREGEASFRVRESAALGDCLALKAAVVATGGGVVLAAENRELMASSGVTVWLNAPLPVLLDRLHTAGLSSRPLLTTSDGAHRLWGERLPLYRLADYEIEVGAEESAEDTAGRIVKRLAEGACAT